MKRIILVSFCFQTVFSLCLLTICIIIYLNQKKGGQIEQHEMRPPGRAEGGLYMESPSTMPYDSMMETITKKSMEEMEAFNKRYTYTLGKGVDATGRPLDCGDSIHRSNVIQRVLTRSDGQGGGYSFIVEPLDGDNFTPVSEWKTLADLYPSSRIHVVNYEIVIRNWTSDYLHVKPFTLTKGTNPETAAYCYATNPHAETGLSFHGTIPDDSPQTLTWLLNPEPFELDDEGKPSIPVASSPTQTIDVCVPQLIKDQPWLLDEIIFNFTETEVFISYFLRVRNHMMEFLPNGQLWDGMAYLHNGHSIEEANSKRTENVENPFLLHQNQGYGIIVSNRTDKNLKISDFPSWSLSPNCRWTDSPTDETMRPFSRISTWNVQMPESEPDRCFELNWKIVDGDSQDGPPAVIRAGRQVCPLPELDQIRQHNEIYAINFIWDGDQLQVAYTVVQGSTLVDMLPDMSIAPKSLMAPQQSLREFIHDYLGW